MNFPTEMNIGSTSVLPNTLDIISKARELLNLIHAPVPRKLPNQPQIADEPKAQLTLIKGAFCVE